MRTSALALAVVPVLAFLFPAFANDSTAELSTGGLIFVRNDAVEMVSEDLAISAKEVSVRYRFFNKSDKDVTVLVAFPMPDIVVEGMFARVSVPTRDPVNLLAFATVVNGKPVTTQVEQRAFAAALDRTQLLRTLGIPLAPHLAETNEELDRLPPEKWDEFVRIGMAEIEEYDIGRGMKKHLAARWTLQTTYYWEQTFPAKAETVIAHRYKPSVGRSMGTALGASDYAKGPGYQEYKEKYCLNSELLGALDHVRKAANAKDAVLFSEKRIDYVLKTGANWSGPIKDFRLVVDKGAAENLVSFCGENVKKVGDTQFEMRKTDYTPDGNLSILILKPL